MSQKTSKNGVNAVYIIELKKKIFSPISLNFNMVVSYFPNFLFFLKLYLNKSIDVPKVINQ